VLRYVSYLVPARYFIRIIRGVMLKGSDLFVLWHEAAFLVLLAFVLLAIATKRFQLKIG
jgi:ABC-2 type transport system permease protein